MHHYHRQAAEQLLREAPDQQQAAVHAFIGCTLQLAQQLQSLHKQATTTDGGRVTGLNSLRKLEAWSCLAVAGKQCATSLMLQHCYQHCVSVILQTFMELLISFSDEAIQETSIAQGVTPVGRVGTMHVELCSHPNSTKSTKCSVNNRLVKLHHGHW